MVRGAKTEGAERFLSTGRWEEGAMVGGPLSGKMEGMGASSGSAFSVARYRFVLRKDESTPTPPATVPGASAEARGERRMPRPARAEVALSRVSDGEERGAR